MPRCIKIQPLICIILRPQQDHVKPDANRLRHTMIPPGQNLFGKGFPALNCLFHL